MSDFNLTARVGSDKFPICISSSSLEQFLSYIDNYKPENIAFIIDSFFEDTAKLPSSSFGNYVKNSNAFFLDGGLESKGLETYSNIIDWLIDKKIPRDGLLVGVGGGVVGDITAFVASTYQRGINLIHIPTTTTAMIDSSVGGKTGLNYANQVNLIGTYHNPSAIFMDPRFLLSLNMRDYTSGICEAIKMSVTSDKDFFTYLLNNSNALLNFNLETMTSLVHWSVLTKLRHVCDDAKEKSIRLILNYGHTFGQSIETYYGLFQDHLRHGEAVGLGMIVAGALADAINKNKGINENIMDQSLKAIQLFNLPTTLDPDIGRPPLEVLVNNLINDKKRTSQGNRFILCSKIGTANVEYINEIDMIKKSFSAIY